jgi:hypothetical protein
MYDEKVPPGGAGKFREDGMNLGHLYLIFRGTNRLRGGCRGQEEKRREKEREEGTFVSL